MSGHARHRERRAQRAHDGDRKIRLRGGPLDGDTRHLLSGVRVFYSTFADAKGRQHQIVYAPDRQGAWTYRGITEVRAADGQ